MSEGAHLVEIERSTANLGSHDLTVRAAGKSHACTLIAAIVKVWIMSRLCTKPTCAEPAVAWLEVGRLDRRVIEQRRPTASALALCAAHRARFGVPEGWTIEALTEAGQSEITLDSAEHRPLLSGATRAHQVAPALDTRAGSLLRRAFHGPDREDDLRRRDEDARSDAESAEVDELELKRHARSMVDDYGTAQLPFPPLGDEPQSAVS